MRISLLIGLMATVLFACNSKSTISKELRASIQSNESFAFVKKKALEVVKTGFNAGDGYGEVWIRDYNTFIELSAEVYPKEELKENLRVFFRLQGNDGNIIDGFIPKEKAEDVEGGYTYIYNDLEPVYCGHKNTVETDHESSLVQAVYKYVRKTGDKAFLGEKIGDKTVAERLQWSMEFLMNHRWSKAYGLVYGATTADWGDVQHCHPWGVYVTDETKYCIDIYDNAMMVIALNNIMELLPETQQKWLPIRNNMVDHIMKTLWDNDKQKFIPHVYLKESPYPVDFNENEIFYHGGTAVAIEAGLLSKAQIKVSLDKMIANVKASGAGSIGLTMYPPYPSWAFENKGMVPYGYQNGGDWTWFGARMIQQLVRYGFYQEAYDQLVPMTDRVLKNKGFYEWYTVDNKPTGSGTFRGSAGVLYKAIEMLEGAVEK
ncbi:glucosidase family protein [Saccharicrinis fermentans]|uniref:Cellobiose phosphorylase n=1 Tax=Saccharicrinis fermentans DSM 9555 = JCM 21142 TaxID=869213 RepID=W7XUA1_9BACT|nr:hypothetical protein [Saccharicrinis fermentans]GAF01565.1 hypothetical protein JCM21142_177 [Saccharicrinis fermentans DSM 9555 = JCM 21142]